MPMPLLHVGATVMCAHAGQAQPTVPNPRVTVSGQATVQMTYPYTISGCTMPPPNAGNGPCVTGIWSKGALRVSSMGQPLLLMDSQATCVPTGTPLTPSAAQMRVVGT